MSISRSAVRRPIFTIMVTLIVIILGAISLVRLPVDLMPDITYPTLSITCTYENASPVEMEDLVTRPIEEAVSAVPGVDQVTSVSAEGASNIRISFNWGTNLDAAAADVRDRLDRVVNVLPDEAERPTLRKYDMASFPILILGASAELDPVQLRKIIDDQVKYRLERIPGVAAAEVSGGLDREIHVNLFADKIKALGLPLDQILDRIKAENVNLPGGTIDRGSLSVAVRTMGEYTNLDQLANTIVAIRQGAPVRLKDVARVEDSWQRVTRLVRINGKPGVRLVIYKQSGANTVECATKVLRELELIRQDLPQINLTTIIDTSKYVKRSVTNVGSSALYGGALAILVLLFFLRNIASTLILATAIPVSIVATFALMYFSGFTLNIMTLGGLALGVGMLVDNAIVVLENIFRYREAGHPRIEAAIEGCREVSGAIVASTLTTLTVFLPLIFMRGMAGIMFTQLSWVIGFSLLCSLAVAVTLVPMLAGKTLRRPLAGPDSAQGRKGRASRWSEGLFRGLENDYKSLLRFALGHRKLVVFLSLAVLGASFWLVPLVGVELMPQTDEGEVRVYAEMEVGTRVQALDEKFRQIEAIVDRVVPEKESSMSFLGGTAWRPSGTHTGQLRISLKPQAERTRSSAQIAADLRRQLAGIPGVDVRTRPGRGLFVMRMGFQSEDSVEMDVRGHDLEVADALAEQLKRLFVTIDGVADARVSSEVGGPEEQIIVDRLRAADLKLSVSQVANMLQTVLSGTRAGYYRQAGKEYPIMVQVEDSERLALSELLDLTLTNADGKPVVLGNIVQVKSGSGPVRIQRKDQERVVTVSGELSGRDLGSVIRDLRPKLASIPIPPDFSLIFGGDYEEQQEAFRELLLSLALALALVYMVMACQFESLRHPMVIMFSVPFAAIGVILILFLTRTTFNIQSYIGCIMLGGIVVNNAILLVDQANLLRRRDGLPLIEAVAEAGRRRLRPILMTVLTTVLGLVPLALGLGEGGEAQAPMARAVIGGLTSSTLITLVLVPSIYTMFERRSAEKAAEEVEVQAPLGQTEPAVLD